MSCVFHCAASNFCNTNANIMCYINLLCFREPSSEATKLKIGDKVNFFTSLSHHTGPVGCLVSSQKLTIRNMEAPPLTLCGVMKMG